MILDRTTPPPVTPFSDIILPPEHVEHLANGITFHYVDTGEQPLSQLLICWEGGEYDFTNPAVITVLAQALREQTKRYSDVEIADIIDFNGAQLTSKSLEHYVRLDLVTLTKKLPQLLPVVRSVITEATFSEQYVGVVTRKLASDQAVKMSKVSYVADTKARQLMSGASHPASNEIKPDDFLAVTPGQLVELYEQLKQSKIHAFLGGSLGEETISLVRDFLLSLDAGTESPVIIKPYSAEPMSDIIHIEMPSAKQSAVTFAMPTINRTHPDYITLRLAIMGLGGYFGSRLMHNIREEKGLTYGIYSALLGIREGAYMQIAAQCDAKYVDALIEETFKEIKNLVTNPPSGDELNRLRQNAWMTLAATTDTSISALAHYVSSFINGSPSDYFQAQLHAIDKLSPGRIAEVTEKYLIPDQIRIVTSGI